MAGSWAIGFAFVLATACTTAACGQLSKYTHSMFPERTMYTFQTMYCLYSGLIAIAICVVKGLTPVMGLWNLSYAAGSWVYMWSMVQATQVGQLGPWAACAAAVTPIVTAFLAAVCFQEVPQRRFLFDNLRNLVVIVLVFYGHLAGNHWVVFWAFVTAVGDSSCTIAVRMLKEESSEVITAYGGIVGFILWVPPGLLACRVPGLWPKVEKGSAVAVDMWALPAYYHFLSFVMGAFLPLYIYTLQSSVRHLPVALVAVLVAPATVCWCFVADAINGSPAYLNAWLAVFFFVITMAAECALAAKSGGEGNVVDEHTALKP